MRNIENSIIDCYDRLVDREPESHSQWLDSISDIASGVEVGIAGKSASAMEESCSAGSEFVAQSTALASVFGTNIDNGTSVLQSLVFDKTLQLPKSPCMEHLVESPSIIGTDALADIFHGYNISSSQTAYNLFADLMVRASHKTCPSARDSFEMSLGGFRSFALQGGYKPLMLSHLRNDTAEKLTIGSDGKVLYSDIYAENTPMLSRAQVDINVFGKAQAEKHYSFFVNPHNAFADFPVGIFRSICRHGDVEFLPAIKSGDVQYPILIGKAPWRIESHRLPCDNRFAFGFFDRSTSLFNAGNRKLSRKPYASQMFVNKRVKFDVIFDVIFPSCVNAILQSILININSPFDNITIRNFQIDSCRCSTQHIPYIEIETIYSEAKHKEKKVIVSDTKGENASVAACRRYSQ